MERPAVGEVASLIVAPDDKLRDGQRVARYEIIRLLGAGGMGEVYLARDTRLNRQVALKVLPAHLTTDELRLSRFKQEARAASALNHPNIITIHEIGEEGGTHFIATEFVEGETLRQKISHGRLEISEAVEIAAQVASALSVAHAAGVVHRDIKSENVMLRPDGIVKLLDFGLAKLNEQTGKEISEATTKRLTNPGMILGTVNYMSPEQAQGAKIDYRTDLWSLGVVLYEMVAGQLPFAGKTSNHTLVAIMEQKPPPLSKRNSQTPAELERTVTKLLAKEQGARYQTADDLLTALRGLQKQLGSIESGSSIPLSSPSGQQPNSLSSIAILPFSAIGLREDEEYLGLGLADALITQLSRARQLAVRPTSAVRNYTNPQQNTIKIGHELNVGAILEGTLQRAGERLRVTVQLVSVETENSLWADKFIFSFTDIFDVQDEIATQVAGALLLTISSGEHQKLTARGTDNIEAYQLYLKGRFYLNKSTPDGFHKAVSYFEEALALDSDYELAYAGLAEAFVLGSYICFPPQEALPKARQAATEAITLNPNLAEAHVALGVVKQLYDWDWPGAENEFKRALHLNPNYVMTYRHYGTHLLLLRRFDEALRVFKQGLQLDPLSPLLKAYLALNYLSDGQFDLAIEQCLSVLEIEPDFPPALGFMGISYLQKGDAANAVATFEKQCSTGRTALALANLAHAYGVVGKRTEAQKILSELEEQAKRQYVLPLYFALIYSGLGERERALSFLEKAFDERNSLLPTWLNVDLRFQALRDEPRFQDLLRCLNLRSSESSV
ncbi:MAG: eukaryotic-like serine/threonine-protein kinase [Acidobacteriota bacterium]|nr:eukaryotic-like serine/threonine-protein kinase [Acidobacteriota bacterium]